MYVATSAAGAVTRKGLPFEQDGSHGNKEEAKEKCESCRRLPVE